MMPEIVNENLQLVVLGVVLLIWTPFIKVMDVQAIKLEKEA